MKTKSNSRQIAPPAVCGLALSILTLQLVAPPAQAATLPTFTQITSGPLVEDVGSICAAAWGDFDADGFPDLFVARYDTPNQLYQNNGDGTFARVPFETSIASGQWVTSASWADPDNDGDLDLVVTGAGFFLNNGDGTFTMSRGIVSDSLRREASDEAAGGSWADYDQDGLLDLFVAGWSYTSEVPPNKLLHNEGRGVFSATVPGPVTTDAGPSLGPSWADFDMDGDVDLFVVNMFLLSNGDLNFLYRNDAGGTFVRLTGSQIGPVATDSYAEVSGSWADYDNDGDFDLFVSGFGAPSNLYKNLLSEEGVAKFVRVPLLTESVTADAGVWGDYDNDGFLDLFVPNGLYTAGAPNFLFRNNGDGTFTEIADAAPVFEEQLTASPAWIDYDNDGFLDLFGNDGPLMYGWSEKTSYLYHNDANGNHWLKVKCVGAARPDHTPSSPARVSNRDGIGAKVWLTATIRGQEMRQLREISSGSGRGGSTPLEAHFGLGDATVASTLRVEWPSGLVSELRDVAGDQRLIVNEPQPGPQLESPSLMNGKFQFTLAGQVGQTYRIEVSTNLLVWQLATEETLTQATLVVTLESGAANNSRFYRAVAP